MEKGTNKKDKTKILIGIIILALLFIIITILVLTNNIQEFDNMVTDFVINIIPESFAPFFQTVTQLGGVVILPIIAILVSLILVIIKKDYYGYAIILNITISVCLYLGIKNIVRRLRPKGFRFITETGFSFPSGHTTNNMAFYGLLIYFIYKNIKNKPLKILLISLLSIWILLIGISRIYFNVHYPSDVIAGALLGGICILTTIYILNNSKFFKKALKNN